MVGSVDLTLEIDKYLADNTYPYAILIDGVWGSGKTFFIKQYLNSQSNNKHYIYISLYGITDIREINKQIRIQYLYGRKSTRQKYEITRLGTSIAVDILEKKGINDKYINQCLDLVKKGSMKRSNIVLILDDLERSTIPILDVLGHINGLVEHQGYKVIILANEKEIDYKIDNLELKYLVAKDCQLIEEDKTSLTDKWYNNQSNGNGSKKNEMTFEVPKDRMKTLFFEKSRYHILKEKVIGRVYIFKPNIKETIAEILKSISSYYKNIGDYDYYKNIIDLISNKENEISEIMEQQSYINLRTYQFFLSKMFILYGSLKNEKNSNSTNINKLLDNYCIFIFKECLSFKQDKKQELNLDLLERFLSDYIRGIENSSNVQFVEKIWMYYDIVNSKNKIDVAVSAIYDWNCLNSEEVQNNFLYLKNNVDNIDFMLYKRILSSLVFLDEYNILEGNLIKSFITSLRENNNIAKIPEASITDLKIYNFENEKETEIYKSYLYLLLQKNGIQVENPFEKVCNNTSFNLTNRINTFEVNYLPKNIVDKILKKLKEATLGSEIREIYYLLDDVYVSNLSEWRRSKILHENITSLISLKDEIRDYRSSESEMDPIKKFWLEKMIEKIEKITNSLYC